MSFKRIGCVDIGLKCGGWGRNVMELKDIEIDKLN